MTELLLQEFSIATGDDEDDVLGIGGERLERGEERKRGRCGGGIFDDWSERSVFKFRSVSNCRRVVERSIPQESMSRLEDKRRTVIKEQQSFPSFRILRQKHFLVEARSILRRLFALETLEKLENIRSSPNGGSLRFDRFV